MEGIDVELVAESQRPVLPLDEGDGDESGEGLCWLMHWATAKPAREGKQEFTQREAGQKCKSTSSQKDRDNGRVVDRCHQLE